MTPRSIARGVLRAACLAFGGSALVGVVMGLVARAAGASRPPSAPTGISPATANVLSTAAYVGVWIALAFLSDRIASRMSSVARIANVVAGTYCVAKAIGGLTRNVLLGERRGNDFEGMLDFLAAPRVPWATVIGYALVGALILLASRRVWDWVVATFGPIRRGTADASEASP